MTETEGITEQEALAYINATPELLSLLYDLAMLPEQCPHGSRDWFRMLMIADAWRNRKAL